MGWWRRRVLWAWLLLATAGAEYPNSRQDETCLAQMATGRRLRGNPIRFVSLIGTEGSGHHLLTPVIRKIMAAALAPGQDDIGTDHDIHYGFTGAGELFHAFKGNNLPAFQDALRQQARGSLVQQEYSFPTGDLRSVDHKIYNLTDLYQMLETSGVEQKLGSLVVPFCFLWALAPKPLLSFTYDPE